MSKLRPELHTGSVYPAVTNGTAYLMILTSVKEQGGLIHGRLHKAGDHCAIGSYFTTNPRTALYEDLIDEVAAVNDSVPTYTKRQRKLHVMKWLRWKLALAGMPGFAVKK